MDHYDSVLNTRMILAAAEDARLDGQALLQAAAICPESLQDPFAGVPAARQFALLEAAVGASGDPAFGLNMARCWNRPGAMDAVGYRIASSGSFRSMIETGYEALRRFSNLQDVRLETQEGVARIVYRPARPDWPLWPVLLDFYMASVALQGRLLVDADFAPLEASFLTPAPVDAAPYEEIFRCTLRFGQPWGMLALEPRWLDAPSRLADRELYEVMAGLLGRRPAQSGPDAEPGAPLAARVRAELAGLIQGGAPTLGTLAGRLRMRPRTLQHQLRREGLTYNDLVSEVRRGLVLSLLRESEATLDEIAWRVGFGSQSSFFRSFRNWTGLTPTAYRRKFQSP